MPGIDINNNGQTDFKINITQIVSVLAMICSIIGSYYTLNGRLESLESEVKKVQTNQHDYFLPNMRAVEADIQQMKIEQKAFEKDIMYLFEKKRR